MIRGLRTVIVIAAVVAVAGCAAPVPLQRAQIDAITRDAPPAAVEQALGKATPTAQFEFTASDNPFFVRHYMLQTGRRQEMTMVCTTFCFPVFYEVPVTVSYLLVQRLPSRAMHAWGTIEELSKDPEPSVSSIMPALKARLEVALKEKK
ncbi:MAG: hypothetical protein K0R58_3324 [Ramlibacter sp.]|jgi:hypothetical protein|nr:hypothetical protein [Ramlibacter sp.]